MNPPAQPGNDLQELQEPPEQDQPDLRRVRNCREKRQILKRLIFLLREECKDLSYQLAMVSATSILGVVALYYSQSNETKRILAITMVVGNTLTFAQGLWDFLDN